MPPALRVFRRAAVQERLAGGILAIAPDHSGICVWSPPLDAAGNSVAGRVALHELTERLGLSIF